MKYITSAQAAEKWGFHIRTIQVWAKNGKLAGAKKQGRDWFIPEDAFPGAGREPKADVHPPEKLLLPLSSGAFKSGSAQSYIDSLSDEEERQMATAEFHYFRGNPQAAFDAAALLLNSASLPMQISALTIHSMASLARGQIETTAQDFSLIRAKFSDASNTDDMALCAFIYNMTRILLHDTPHEVIDFSVFIGKLPVGLRFLACYVQAHYEYIRGNYEKSLGIAEAALLLSTDAYPLPAIYLHLICAVNYMNLLERDKAVESFRRAWDLALPELFLEPFAEHHGLLQGLIEVCVRPADAELFERITAITYKFSAGWRKLHKARTQETIAGNLTTTEFSIAMLFSKGWTYREIARYMHISPHTAKYYISIVYQKLQISNRSELKRYMLR